MAESVITLNTASMGGGLYFDGGSPSITWCNINENSAFEAGVVTDDGGGIYCLGTTLYTQITPMPR